MTAENVYTITRDPAVTGDPDAGQFLARAEDKVNALRDLVVRVAVGLAQIREQLDALGRDGGRAEADRRRAEEEIRGAALENLEQVQGGAEAVRQGIMLLIDDAIGAALPSPRAPAEVEEERGRDESWERVQRDLDGVAEPGRIQRAVEEIAAEAARASDSATLRALRERLPDYLAGRGITVPATEVAARVDEIEAQGMAPMQRAAVLTRAALTAGWPRVMHAMELARAEISGRGSRLDVLPGFGPDEQVRIE